MSADVSEAVEAMRGAIEWDKQRGYRMPYRVRDPLYAAIDALQEGSGALPASPSGGKGSSAAPIPTETDGPSAGQWSRERACVAAAEASRAFREWVPQTWLTLFFNAYEGQPEGYRKPLLGPASDMMVSAILLAGVPEIDAKRADELSVTITDAMANTPSMGIREANETQPNQPRDREEG